MLSQMEEDTTFFVLILICDALLNIAAFNKCACSSDSLCGSRSQKITLIAPDEQPCIELLHAAVDVLLVATKRMDAKDVTGNESS